MNSLDLIVDKKLEKEYAPPKVPINECTVTITQWERGMRTDEIVKKAGNGRGRKAQEVFEL